MLDVMNLVGTFLVMFLSIVLVAVMFLGDRGVYYTPEIAQRSEQLDRFEYFDRRNKQILERLIMRATVRARQAALAAPREEAFGVGELLWRCRFVFEDHMFVNDPPCEDSDNAKLVRGLRKLSEICAMFADDVEVRNG